MQLAPGDRVGPYEITGLLGAGGMGSVYRARDPRLGRQVAIKILQEKLVGNRDYLSRFEREARAASALNHPNIVTVYDIGELQGAPYIAMEHIDGTRLRDVMNQGPLSARKILQIASQIADGLATAHEHGIIHRDLKPENVMITADGRVKVLDFGLARLKREPVGEEEPTSEVMSARTREGAVIGTAGYMSPEQASGSTVDFRSDQFSLGSMLYEMATGRRPFRRTTTLDTLSAIVHEEPESIEKLNPRIPPPLRWAIERCLAKDPRERYASTGDLARDLQTIREHLGESTTAETAATIRVALPRYRVLAAAAVVLALTAVAVVWTLGRSDGKVAELLPERKSLAVLPFKDLSGDPKGRLVGEGFAESLSARLANATGIQVIRPSAAAKHVPENASVARIAQELGANMILRGEIQRSGEEIFLSYSVVDPRGVTLASGNIKERGTDIFSMQEPLADSIFGALGLQLDPTRAVMLESGLESSVDQERYLEAIGHLQHFENPISVEYAIAILEDLAKKKSALTYAALGRAYLHKYYLTRDPAWAEKAFTTCQEARRLDPRSPEVHLTLGELNRQTGRIEDAIAELKRALANQPNSPEAILALGDTYRQKGDLAQAEQFYRRGIDLNPDWWAGYNKLGTLFLHQGQLARAEQMLREAIKLSPENAWAQSNLGATYVLRGQFESAIAAFRRVIAIKPDAGSYTNLGNCYYLLHRYSEAAAASEKATELAPQNSLYWKNLGDAYRWIPGREAKATECYRRAIDLAKKELAVNPAEPQAHATIALSYAKLGDTARAKQHIEEAMKLQPANAQRIYQAALVANLGGNKEAALDLLRRAFDAGYSRIQAEREPELDNLRREVRFQEILRTTARM